MNVANILPGDDVAVELRYTELLTPTDAQYGFVFPTVVGPRYNSPQGAAVNDKWVSTPYLKAGETSPAAFDIKVTLDTPVPVREVGSDDRSRQDDPFAAEDAHGLAIDLKHHGSHGRELGGRVDHLGEAVPLRGGVAT